MNEFLAIGAFRLKEHAWMIDRVNRKAWMIEQSGLEPSPRHMQRLFRSQ